MAHGDQNNKPKEVISSGKKEKPQTWRETSSIKKDTTATFRVFCLIYLCYLYITFFCHAGPTNL